MKVRNGRSESNCFKGFEPPEFQDRNGGGVVDSWSDGQGNFWRKYADGFIEQGGEFPGSTSHSDNTITLNKEFTNLGYQVFVQPTWLGNDGLGSRVWKKTLTSFTAVFASVDDPHAMWYACGY